jgi:endonuclease YncB( thermonuclease family)
MVESQARPGARTRAEGECRGCPHGRRQSHKYDRYLADVFFGSQSSEASAKEDVFLNNELLSTGHAIRYDGGTKEIK